MIRKGSSFGRLCARTRRLTKCAVARSLTAPVSHPACAQLAQTQNGLTIMKLRLLLHSGVALLLIGCGGSGPPYSPRDAMKTFRLEQGFRIEPFLAEPDVHSPDAMEFDENGRFYVVENPGYPLNVEGKVGRVILFEDTNGDGRPDRRTVFAEHLTLPTGIMRWKKGVVVTDAPDVLYLEDSNGDGK